MRWEALGSVGCRVCGCTEQRNWNLQVVKVRSAASGALKSRGRKERALSADTVERSAVRWVFSGGHLSGGVVGDRLQGLKGMTALQLRDGRQLRVNWQLERSVFNFKD